MNVPSPYFIQHPSPPAGEGATVFKGPLLIEEDEGLDLWNYWRVIWKHPWLIATVFFATVLATAFVVFRTTPLYTAEATLLIERKAPQVLDIREVLSEDMAFDEYDYYKTQYEILKSRTLAARVVRDLDLEHNSLFTGEGGKKVGLVAALRAQAQAWIKERLGAGQTLPQLSPSPEENPLGVKPQLINAYIGMLEIKPLRQTRLVKVSLKTPDPALSARMANAHTQAYIRQGLELQTQARGGAQRFLEEKLVELKERVEKSEVALNRYRRDKGIISLDDKENTVVDRLADLNKRLTEAEAERIAQEAQVRLIRKRDYGTLPAVIGSTLIQTLKEQLAHLESDYAQLSTQFKSGYPRLDQLQVQVEETRRRLQQEIQQVIGGIESAYLTAEAQEKELRAKMEEQKVMALGLKDASVDYGILDREVNTNRQLYDSVLQRMKEMGVAAELRASNISVIDPAEVPLAPSEPRKMHSLFLSALLGLIGGVGLAFLLEYLDRTLKTPEEVERYLSLPNLAMVPDFSRLRDRNGYAPKLVLSKVERAVSQISRRHVNLQLRTSSIELILSHHPFSAVTEAYRTLRTAIVLSRAGEAPKTILFTSAKEGEGKTATTVNTAIVFAQMGLRVLLIDADLRRARCHQLLKMENQEGLTELLTGQRTVHEVIEPTPTENLFLISSGATPPNPAELVGSPRMYEVLQDLQKDYDCICIDSPPVMPIVDAVLLSTLVDGVVLVVDRHATPRKVVKQARSRLSYARAKILGVVLNRVNTQGGDNAYYYHHYSSYSHHTTVESQNGAVRTEG